MGLSPLILLPVFITIIKIVSFYNTSNQPWEPKPRVDPIWFSKHRSFLRSTQENSSQINCVFIGSSSIEYWGTTAKSLWNKKYIPLGAVNYGIGGDRTENVLWRIANGELDGLNPKLIVVYIGSNNIITNSTVDEIVRGVTTVLKEIRVKLPHTRILYVEFLPRGGKDIQNRWKRITAVNKEIRKLNDGNNLVSFNMFWKFADNWLVIKKELYKFDKLHLNKKGYDKWDAKWNSTFWNLLESK